MLIHSASQLLTLAGGPQRGSALGHFDVIPDGAVLVHGNQIAATGTTRELRAAYPDEPALDAGGKVVMPGLVDPCTNLIWAESPDPSPSDPSAAELALIQATAQARPRDLLDQARGRARSMFRHGTTTTQALMSYALQPPKALELLNILSLLDAEGPLEALPACLGMTALPTDPDFSSENYTNQVCDSILPAAADWWEARFPDRGSPAVALDCGQAAFDLTQARLILARARRLGLPIHLLAGSQPRPGAATLAIEFEARALISQADLPKADLLALAASRSALIALPAFSYCQRDPTIHDLKPFLQAGGLLALGTGLNPVSAWGENLQLVIWMACNLFGLTVEQAIAAATINAAAVIARDRQVGSLEAGKQADLLVLNCSDYRLLGRRYGVNLVQQVIKKGKVFTWVTF